jgi:hypothetical protein
MADFERPARASPRRWARCQPECSRQCEGIFEQLHLGGEAGDRTFANAFLAEFG